MRGIPGVENTKAVKDFFDHWNIYHKVVKHNYMSHRQVYRILHRFLMKLFPKQQFSLLDLGCGDAEFMSRTLAGTRVCAYTGVDISKVALTLAKKNTSLLPCRKRFIYGDFFKEIRHQRWADIIWMSIAFHHLRRKQKADFFMRCRQVCAPAGYFIFYEPTLREGRDRSDFLKRWWAFCSKHWKALTARELLLIKKHIMEDDFPERFSTYARLAHKAGFTHAQQVYIDRSGVNMIIVLN